LLIIALTVYNPVVSVSGQLIMKIGSNDNSVNSYSEKPFGSKAGLDDTVKNKRGKK
jgi:hypothetical protein